MTAYFDLGWPHLCDLFGGHGSDVKFYYDADNVESIMVVACDGDDLVDVHHNVSAPAMIDGGSGCDVLLGGSGDDCLVGGDGWDVLLGGCGSDILLGQDGNDLLVGGLGRDLLIGGRGCDLLVCGLGHDMLISGTTDYDGDKQALRAILDEWNCDRPIEVRIGNITDGSGTPGEGFNHGCFFNVQTIHDDLEVDTFDGVTGEDWLIAESSVIQGDLSSVVLQDRTLVVQGGDGDDRFEFTDDGAEYTVRLKLGAADEQVFVYLADDVDNVVFDGGEGSDTVVYNGSDDGETAKMWPDHAEFTGSAVVTAANVEAIEADMNGGDDTVEMYGSDNAELGALLVASAVHATFLSSTPGVNLEAFDCETLRVESVSGKDWAQLYDTVRDEHFQASNSPNESVLTGTVPASGLPYELKTVGMVYTHAYASRGYDTADMYDTAGDDNMYAYKGNVFVYDVDRTVDPRDNVPTYYRRAKGFDLVTAHASGGSSAIGDVAYIHDDHGDDEFSAWPDHVMMERYIHFDPGSGERLVNQTVVAAGFDYAHAYAINHGNDVANLYDSPEDDVLDARVAWTSLSNLNPTDPANKFFVRAKFFEQVVGHASEGLDKAWLRDSAGADTFEGRAGTARLYGAGFDNTAEAFDQVYGLATMGTGDVADLYGSDEQDMFAADLAVGNAAHWARVFANHSLPTDFFYEISGFDSATAHYRSSHDDITGIDPDDDHDVERWLALANLV